MTMSMIMHIRNHLDMHLRRRACTSKPIYTQRQSKYRHQSATSSKSQTFLPALFIPTNPLAGQQTDNARQTNQIGQPITSNFCPLACIPCWLGPARLQRRIRGSYLSISLYLYMSVDLLVCFSFYLVSLFICLSIFMRLL